MAGASSGVSNVLGLWDVGGGLSGITLDVYCPPGWSGVAGKADCCVRQGCDVGMVGMRLAA